jgi:hypothetical protein
VHAIEVVVLRGKALIVVLLYIMVNALLEGVNVRVGCTIGHRGVDLRDGGIFLLGCGVLGVRAQDIAACVAGHVFLDMPWGWIFGVQGRNIIVMVITVK